MNHLIPFQTSSEINREAWRIRKEAAAKFGARPTFIAWGPCYRKAKGEKRVILTTALGSDLKAKGAWIDLAILHPDCPMNLDADTLNEMSGVDMKTIRLHLGWLESIDVLNNRFGFVSVPHEKRPYSPDLDSWARWEAKKDKEAQAAVEWPVEVREHQHVTVTA